MAASARAQREERLSALLVGLLLTGISTWYLVSRVIRPFASGRAQFFDAIFAGTQEPPYQYRVLMHVLARGIAFVLAPFFDDHEALHVWAYGVLTFLVFAGIYALLFLLLRRWFSRATSIVGMMLFQAVVPLSVTGYVIEGDFFTVLAYLAGLHLMVRGRDAWLPLLAFVATFNREQMIWLAVFHGIFLYTHGLHRQRGKLLALGGIFAGWGAAMLATRLWFGFKESQYTWFVHLQANTDSALLERLTIPLWLAEVAVFLILAGLALRRSNDFFRLAFASLSVYTVLYFFHGHMWELAKWLPAYLVLIPMALQVVMGETMPRSLVASPAPPPAGRAEDAAAAPQ